MMPPDEIRRQFLMEWLTKAHEDREVAHYLLDTEVPYLGIIGFHAQQAVEKYLKAYLVWKQVEFPKTHNIEQLLDIIATCNSSLALSLHQAIILTDYAVEARYPGNLPELTPKEAAGAVGLADMTYAEVMDALKDIITPC
ncbi:MAG TPA: HEPN domain-containing protein [Candidatus Hydrogenedentes bacterium]|nr:HEPN domain-containing protein [Candidatus Hydrogenedentota bacterium]